jgi:hypothetical protein
VSFDPSKWKKVRASRQKTISRKMQEQLRKRLAMQKKKIMGMAGVAGIAKASRMGKKKWKPAGPIAQAVLYQWPDHWRVVRKVYRPARDSVELALIDPMHREMSILRFHPVKDLVSIDASDWDYLPGTPYLGAELDFPDFRHRWLAFALDMTLPPGEGLLGSWGVVEVPFWVKSSVYERMDDLGRETQIHDLYDQIQAEWMEGETQARQAAVASEPLNWWYDQKNSWSREWAAAHPGLPQGARRTFRVVHDGNDYLLYLDTRGDETAARLVQFPNYVVARNAWDVKSLDAIKRRAFPWAERMLRTHHPTEGKLENLVRRFADHVFADYPRVINEITGDKWIQLGDDLERIDPVFEHNEWYLMGVDGFPVGRGVSLADAITVANFEGQGRWADEVGEDAWYSQIPHGEAAVDLNLEAYSLMDVASPVFWPQDEFVPWYEQQMEDR